MRHFFLYISIFCLFTLLTVLGCSLFEGGICGIVSENSVYIGSAAIHMGIFFLAMYFLWKDDLKSTLEGVGFPGSLKNTAVYSIACLAMIFFVLFILSAVAMYAGFNDQEKITEKITGLPAFILIFAALIAPISEELFFRGLLTKRIGVVLSAVAFGISHLAYGSVLEVAGTMLVGLILGMTFKMSKSITPCILAHMAYNTMAVIFYTFFLES